MENIRQAIERARGHGPGDAERGVPGLPHRNSDVPNGPVRTFELNEAHLESKRIVCQDSEDPRSKSFDMLRTHVLRTMDMKGWKILAITSPTVGCGKTVTAVNLALSIARQPERSVLLVDLDMRKAEVGDCLGVPFQVGVIDVLDGRADLESAVVQAYVGDQGLSVLPTSRIRSGSAERMASQAMSTMLQNIKRDYPSRIVIIDMPPILASDDVLTVLPQLDCVLLVAAVGVSSVSEISECNKHLQSADVVRYVLNKVPDAKAPYYPNYTS